MEERGGGQEKNNLVLGDGRSRLVGKRRKNNEGRLAERGKRESLFAAIRIERARHAKEQTQGSSTAGGTRKAGGEGGKGKNSVARKSWKRNDRKGWVEAVMKRTVCV